MSENEFEPSDSTSKAFASTEEREAWLDAVMERRGFKPAPPDHPIYREDPTAILGSPRAKPKKGQPND